ncbi:PREDICTED: uncharacterized protein LOC108381183, partial [Rhagoletis zephyria]|uniref:uncharacterized protein LOC108381183 n=1 Tax=Rhagoletis zephyria TaxID=28612 RepID=UPI00081197EE
MVERKNLVFDFDIYDSAEKLRNWIILDGIKPIFFQNLTALLSLITLSPIDQEYAELVKDICLATAAEHEIRTFIYTCGDDESSDHHLAPVILQKLQTKNPIPLLNIDALAPVELYKDKFNLNLLSIVQLSQNPSSNDKVLRTLWQRLHLNVQSDLVLLFDDKASDEYVAEILQLCAENRAINVIALQPQMAVKERSYWTMKLFPVQRTIKLTFPAFYRAMFPKHMENMYGHEFRVFGNIWIPRFYDYKPKRGPATISGFMGRALAEYVKRHNGTIVYSLTNEYNLSPSQFVSRMKNRTTVVGKLVGMQFPHDDVVLTNTIHIMDTCLMIPLEEGLPKLTFYYAILNKTQVPLIEYFVKFSVLQGLFGMPFCTSRIHRTIAITISFAGIIIGTAYGTYLQSFTVNAPIASPIKTIDDILKRGLKIPIFAPWIKSVKTIPEFESYTGNFTLFNNLSEILSLRDKFDTHYAFPVENMWLIYNEAQKYFSKPLFRLSDICLWNKMPMALPLPENSEYLASLDIFLARLHAAGLINHWLKHTIIELLEMDLIYFEDRNKQPEFVPLKLQDLRMVLIAMGVLEALS